MLQMDQQIFVYVDLELGMNESCAYQHWIGVLVFMEKRLQISEAVHDCSGGGT
jgi:hypothetical protein